MMEEERSDSPMQGYFEWQVSTFWLAYDVLNPLEQDDEDGALRRRQFVEQEVSRITLEVVPDIYKQDNSLDWPPSLMRTITSATLSHAARIVAGEISLDQ